jgi:hypothetical protein
VVAGAPEAGIPRVSCPQETLSFPPFIQAGGGRGGDWLVLWETFLKSVLESMGNIWWLVPNRSAGSKVKVWVIWLLGSNPTEGFLMETFSLASSVLITVLITELIIVIKIKFFIVPSKL